MTKLCVTAFEKFSFRMVAQRGERERERERETVSQFWVTPPLSPAVVVIRVTAAKAWLCETCLIARSAQPFRLDENHPGHLPRIT